MVQRQELWCISVYHQIRIVSPVVFVDIEFVTMITQIIMIIIKIYQIKMVTSLRDNKKS